MGNKTKVKMYANIGQVAIKRQLRSFCSIRNAWINKIEKTHISGFQFVWNQTLWQLCEINLWQNFGKILANLRNNQFNLYAIGKLPEIDRVDSSSIQFCRVWSFGDKRASIPFKVLSNALLQYIFTPHLRRSLSNILFLILYLWLYYVA